jgi:hypothetical protein
MAALAPAQFRRSMEGYVSELSLRFIALHLLSCLGRYRPATWMHALPRAGSADHSADDTMLACTKIAAKRRRRSSTNGMDAIMGRASRAPRSPTRLHNRFNAKLSKGNV